MAINMNTYDALCYRITTDRPPHTNTLTFQKEFLYFRDFKGITVLNFLVTTLFTNHYIISVEVFFKLLFKNGSLYFKKIDCFIRVIHLFVCKCQPYFCSRYWTQHTWIFLLESSPYRPSVLVQLFWILARETWLAA